MKRFRVDSIKLKNGSKDKEWYKLLPLDGDMQGVPLTTEFLNSIISNFNNPIPIDWEHQTYNTEINGQPAPAVGYFDDVKLEDDGLYVHLEKWTKKGKEFIDNEEYRYLSAVVATEDSYETGYLTSASLTNVPYFKETKMFTNKNEREEKDMAKEETKNISLNEHNKLLKERDTEIAKLREENNSLKSEMDNFKENEKEAFQILKEKQETMSQLMAKQAEELNEISFERDLNKKLLDAKLQSVSIPTEVREQLRGYYKKDREAFNDLADAKIELLKKVDGEFKANTHQTENISVSSEVDTINKVNEYMKNNNVGYYEATIALAKKGVL